jgi:transcriptional regulator with XRE-family HTH domain
LLKRKKKYSIERNFVEFGEYLRQAREAAELTQRAVSLELGYSSAQFISNFERGICLPPLNKLKILMKLYRIPKDEVISMISEARTRVLRREL